jgi:hypothetical protein
MASRAFSGVRVTRPLDITPSGEGTTDSDLEKSIRELSAFAETDWRLAGNEFGRSDRPDERQFHELFLRAKTALGTNDHELARELMISIPTVERWTRGETAPAPIGRRTYLRALADVGQKRLRTLSYAF